MELYRSDQKGFADGLGMGYGGNKEAGMAQVYDEHLGEWWGIR